MDTPPSPASGFDTPQTAPAVPTTRPIPVGMAAIMLWYGFVLVTSLATLPCPRLFLGTELYTGFPAASFYLASIAVSSAIIYGLMKRRLWGKWLCVGWEITGALLATAMSTAMIFDLTGAVEAFRETSPWAEEFFTAEVISLMAWFVTAFTWLVALVISAYLLLKKGYFER